MNITKYILAAIVVFALAARYKDTVYLDTKSVPVKVVDRELIYGDLYPVSDGLIEVDRTLSPISNYSIVKQDGSVVMSESLDYPQEGPFYSFDCFQNNSDDFFIYFDSPSVSLAKFDRNGHLMYFRDYDIGYMSTITALDNGEFAFFSKEYSESDDRERMTMRIINNDGELEDYVVYFEDGLYDGFFDQPFWYFYSYNDRIFVFYCDEVDGNTCYRFYNIDGTYVNSGIVESAEGEGNFYERRIARYVAGNLYLLSGGGASINAPKTVTKFDADGNQVFTATLRAASISSNICIKDGSLIVSGSYLLNDEDFSSEMNRIFIIDDNSGIVKDSIDIDYDGVLHVEQILPAYDGCYDVFAYRYMDDNRRAIHIFHTDDLHKLQSDNQ